MQFHNNHRIYPLNQRRTIAALALSILLFSLMVAVAWAGAVQVGDTVWHDLDADGVQDAGEPGLAGVELEIFLDVNKNCMINAGDVSKGTETTDANGFYEFDLDDGWGSDVQYVVRINALNQTEDYRYTSAATVIGGYFKNPDPTKPEICVPIPFADSYDEADFGYAIADVNIVKTAGTADGSFFAPDGQNLYINSGDSVKYKFVVTLGNGDAPLKDVSVTDNLCTSPISGPAKTGGDSDGFLEKGETWTYTCDRTNIVGSEGQEFPNTATAAGTPVNSDTETPLPGGNVTDDDDAKVVIADDDGNVHAFKYYDEDYDGVYDQGSDTPIPNWTLCLDSNVNGQQDGNNCKTTNSSGYASWDVTAGDYEVCEVLPAGWGTSTPVCQAVTAQAGGSDPTAGPTSNTISFDGNSYDITFVNKVGNTWTYNISEVSGKDISHWNIILPGCSLSAIQSTTKPAGVGPVEIGYDPSTGVYGIKWDDVSDGFTSGEFSFTMNADYPMGTIQAGVKAGPDFGAADIRGPVCGIRQFGNYELADIGDYVWYDSDGDAVQDVPEPGIGNVTLDLYKDGGDNVFDANQDTKIGTQATDADGGYIFKDLQPGTYFVDVTDTNGILTGLTHTVGTQSKTDPTPAIVVGPGDVYRDADFGYRKVPDGGKAIIGDYVWYDGDGDAVQDPGEPGIPGVSVCASPAGGGAATCDTTDANGNYLIEVNAGSYIVQPSSGVPGGLTPTTPTSLDVTVAAGDQYLDADFGYDADSLGTIGNQVWHDKTNPNGVFEGGEPGIPGVSVSLIKDVDGDEVRDAGEPIIATGTTNQDGQYRFQGVPAGDYLVFVSDTQNVLDDYTNTAYPGNQTVDNNNKQQPYGLTLAAGGNNLTGDFGYVLDGPPGKLGVIGNQVWYEEWLGSTAIDGIYNPGINDTDNGVAGITVELSKDDQVYATTTTGAAGDYVFTSLPPGVYSVKVTDAAGILNGLVETLFPADQTADNNNKQQPYQVTLTSDGERNMTADFGYTRKGEIGDFVWWDIDDDGRQDAGEPGIPQVNVRLYNTTDCNGPAVDMDTNANGIYLFSNLLADLYCAKIDPAEFNTGGTLEDFVASPQNAGGVPDTLDSDADPTSHEIQAIDLALAEIDRTNDFGFWIQSDLAITKKLNTEEPVSTAPGFDQNLIKFTIWITNTGDTHIKKLPLVDTYDSEYMTFDAGHLGNSPAPDQINEVVNDTSTLSWTDLNNGGYLAPGASKVVVVYFRAKKDTGTLPSTAPCLAAGKTCNIATVTGATADPDGSGNDFTDAETLPPVTDHDPVQIAASTSVALTGQIAREDSDGVLVEWTTINESHIAAFTLWRALDGGQAEKIASVGAKVAGQSAGAHYSIKDSLLVYDQRYVYTLEVMHTDGSREMQELISVTLGSAKLYLPMTVR